MESQDDTLSTPRTIPISNILEFGNIEAWMNIIQSYKAAHPGHTVSILYQDQTVLNLVRLYRLRDSLSHDEFQLLVRAPDDDRKDVKKLFRLMVEGAGPNYKAFINKELYRVLTLF